MKLYSSDDHYTTAPIKNIFLQTESNTVNNLNLRQSVKQKNSISEPVLELRKISNLMNNFHFCVIVCIGTYEYWSFSYGIILGTIFVHRKRKEEQANNLQSRFFAPL